ncbi:hypothetical protein D3C87_2104770 [compost metagenome]
MLACLKLTALGDDRRRSFVAPAHRLVDRLLLGCTQFFAVRLHRSVKACAELVVVVEDCFPEFMLGQFGQLHQRLVA